MIVLKQTGKFCFNWTFRLTSFISKTLRPGVLLVLMLLNCNSMLTNTTKRLSISSLILSLSLCPSLSLLSSSLFPSLSPIPNSLPPLHLSLPLFPSLSLSVYLSVYHLTLPLSKPLSNSPSPSLSLSLPLSLTLPPPPSLSPFPCV